MIFLLNNSTIVYENFDTQDEMSARIIYFIQGGKLDYILFKGDPKDIDGKQKRRFVLKSYTGDLNNIEKIKRLFDKKTHCNRHSWCMLYKNK